MALGENLKHLRKLAGLTQGDLADIAGMKLGHISKLERNETDAKVSTIHKLMEALNCSANDLLHVKGEAGLSQMIERAISAAESLPARDKATLLSVVERFVLASQITAAVRSTGGLPETVSMSIEADLMAEDAEGDLIEITVPQAQDSHIVAQDIPLSVIFEDDDLIVVNKPAGMVVHPAPGTPGGTLVNALIHHCGETLSGVGGMKRPGIVHRIDKETTGLLVAAKTDAAHHGLAKQFADHTVERRYLAVCYGVPEANDPRLRGIWKMVRDGQIFGEFMAR